MARISEEMRRRMIAEAAYYRAERRGFDGGDPDADWLAAEKDIDAQLDKRTITIGGLETRLAVANERLKAFRKTLADMAGEGRKEWEADIARLAKQRDRLRKRINDAQARSGHAAEQAKVQAGIIWEEIRRAIERLNRRKAKLNRRKARQTQPESGTQIPQKHHHPAQRQV